MPTHHPCLDTLARGEIGRLPIGKIDRIDVSVLVAALVLLVKDLFVIPRPAITSNGTIGGLRDGRRLTASDRHDPDVENTVQRREVADLGSVRRNLDVCTLRITEERLSGDEWYILREGGESQNMADRSDEKSTNEHELELLLKKIESGVVTRPDLND